MRDDGVRIGPAAVDRVVHGGEAAQVPVRRPFELHATTHPMFP
jgi:hypothetical protein